MLLTKRDLCERWQLSEKTIESLVKKSVITPVKLDSIIRFNIDEIEEIERTQALSQRTTLKERKLQRENEELKKKIEVLTGVIAKIQMVSTEAVYMMGKDI